MPNDDAINNKTIDEYDSLESAIDPLKNEILDI